MMVNTQNCKLDYLKNAEVDQAITVFLESFKTEAFTRALLDLEKQKNYNLYFRAVEYKFALYLEIGHPIFVARDKTSNKNSIAGLFLLKSPHIKAPLAMQLGRILPLLPVFARLLPNYLRAAHLGPAVKPPDNLPAAHYVLEGLAVAPAYQGKGLARIMLEKAEQVLCEDKTAAGIYLYTGDEKNRAIYERFDYRILKQVPVRTFTAYHMFKWNRGQSSFRSDEEL